jgi:hypothetical protein
MQKPGPFILICEYLIPLEGELRPDLGLQPRDNKHLDRPEMSKVSPQEAVVDRFLAQQVSDARAALRVQPGEIHIRAQGQTKYATIRESRLNTAVRSGQKFWQGKVFLETRLTPDWGNTTKTIFVVLHNGIPIAEVSEFDSQAKQALDFTSDLRYCGRAVIQDDLIGNVAHLFIDSNHKLA